MRVGRTTEALPPIAPTTIAVPESSEGADAPSPRVASTSSDSGVPPFLRLLHGLGQELDRGENLAEKAIRGAGETASMSPARLIALQAGIYRYSEAVDLVTKLVDRGTQAVRTTLQNQ
jgi:hypothetical protein